MPGAGVLAHVRCLVPRMHRPLLVARMPQKHGLAPERGLDGHRPIRTLQNQCRDAFSAKALICFEPSLDSAASCARSRWRASNGSVVNQTRRNFLCR
jgi:hypothetical protein